MPRSGGTGAELAGSAATIAPLTGFSLALAVLEGEALLALVLQAGTADAARQVLEMVARAGSSVNAAAELTCDAIITDAPFSTRSAGAFPSVSPRNRNRRGSS